MSLVAVILMLNAAAAVYYLRVVVYMYMRQPAEDAGEVSVGNATRAGLIRLVATVAIGLAPLHHGGDARLGPRPPRSPSWTTGHRLATGSEPLAGIGPVGREVSQPGSRPAPG